MCCDQCQAKIKVTQSDDTTTYRDETTLYFLASNYQRKIEHPLIIASPEEGPLAKQRLVYLHAKRVGSPLFHSQQESKEKKGKRRSKRMSNTGAERPLVSQYPKHGTSVKKSQRDRDEERKENGVSASSRENRASSLVFFFLLRVQHPSCRRHVIDV
jgi:hypothetical protein